MQTSRLNLARKYRPQTLDEVIGQPTAVKILREALKSDKIAPAYLFSGPRGAGKTTCARIFARAATCLSEKSAERPCGKCASCKAQSQENFKLSSSPFMDLIEIDGASHTGVDDVRSIIDAVAYRPAVGAKSVYIIDEVHMLSNAAFNALLKTLEEPPPHALFLFATTEIEKIPATILSRVQRVELQRLKEIEIVKNLKGISEKEKIKISPAVLEQVAASSDGSLRDAQTLLEQLVLLSGSQQVDPEVTEAFLGTLGVEQELVILESIASRNALEAVKKISQFFEQGKDLPKLLSRLMQWSRALLLLKSCNAAQILKDEFTEEHLQRLTSVFENWSAEDADRLFEVLWKGTERIKNSELPKIVCETTLIRACRIPTTEDVAKILEYLKNQPAASAQQMTAPQMTASQPPAPTFSRSSPMSAPTSAPKPPPSQSSTPSNVEELLKEVKRARPSLFSLLVCSENTTWEQGTLTLRFSKSHFAFKQLSEKILQRELLELVSQLTKNGCTKVELLEVDRSSQPAKPNHFMKEAKDAILNDPTVQKATELLKGKVESVTIEGIKNS